MDILLLVLAFLFFIAFNFVMSEIATWQTYGEFIFTRDSRVQFLMEEDRSDKVIPHDTRKNIFYIKGYMYPIIVMHAPNVISKYHIENIGQVPRFTRLHKRLKEYHTIAENNFRPL